MSFADRDGFIWMDGHLVDWSEAKVHVFFVLSETFSILIFLKSFSNFFVLSIFSGD